MNLLKEAYNEITDHIYILVMVVLVGAAVALGFRLAEWAWPFGE
jgi:RsiW-degrading membrane proteinase PrsW (M82 family)